MTDQPLGPEFAGLGDAGRRLVRLYLAEWQRAGLVPDPEETVALAEAGHLADRLEQVRRALRRGPLTIKQGTGSRKANPLLGEEQRLSLTIIRLLKQVSVSPPPEDRQPTRADLYRKAVKGRGGVAAARNRGQGGR
jgi:hypothetical protein